MVHFSHIVEWSEYLLTSNGQKENTIFLKNFCYKNEKISDWCLNEWKSWEIMNENERERTATNQMLEDHWAAD